MLLRLGDLPNDKATKQLLKRVLEKMAVLFDTDWVKLDTTVYKPAQLTKCYGTMVCKGMSIPTGPHRRSRIMHVPETIQAVSREILEEFAPEEKHGPNGQAEAVPADVVDELRELLIQHDLEIHSEGPYEDSYKLLAPYPFDATHGEAAFFQRADSKRGFHCFHKGCAGKRWRHVLRLWGVEERTSSRQAAEQQAEAEQLKEEAQPEEEKSPDCSSAELLEKVTAFLTRFVSITASQAYVIATWVVHTFCLEAADTTPYLCILSPEKRSGKTRLLELLELIVSKPWFTARATAAALTRKVHAQKPTLLSDEIDTVFNGKEEYSEALRGVLNAGHRRGGKTSCCIGQGSDITVQDFDCFCPKAIAGLNRLPDTLMDRSIVIRMRRKAKTAPVERFRRRKVQPEADKLRRQIAAWAKSQIKSLREADSQRYLTN